MNGSGGGDRPSTKRLSGVRRATEWLTEGTNFLKALGAFVASLTAVGLAVIGLIQLWPDGGTDDTRPAGDGVASGAEIEVAGTLNLSLAENHLVDLDSGDAGSSDVLPVVEVVDLALDRIPSGDLVLRAGLETPGSPMPTRWFTKPAPDQSGFDECAAAVDSSSANPLLSVAELDETPFFCTLTNEGRISELQLIEAQLLDGRIVIEYTTWELSGNNN